MGEQNALSQNAICEKIIREANARGDRIVALERQIRQLQADYEQCPWNGLKGHAWNHLTHDWIGCSLCNARMPSRENLRSRAAVKEAK